MIGLLACLAACSGGHDDNNDPADVDEAPRPLGRSAWEGRHGTHAGDALRPLSRHLPRPPSPGDEAGTEDYHPPPDAAAMQMISSGYDPNQAGDDSPSDSDDGKHFVVPDTQVSYGRQGK
ncbi:hypothetical protein HNW77_05780 [Komagataeibacter sp. AV436]|uniref:Lipoprotein n=1 Tax=Komagataeibacter melomenusus TaxID=2766578 RepID=A0ABX2AC16_9PROT|nr:hypothetical protein [Komagataeibacter melomenusus]MBV1830350.1 hypothetical protein [Komagataeibacter melomenusus]NPC65906.1 hypothetical protein [Komagataeibacter melomenusus]